MKAEAGSPPLTVYPGYGTPGFEGYIADKPARSASELILEVAGLHKHFGPLHVLRGISLRVAPQEPVFVIGPSSTGKSTLLRCLSRFEEPSAGPGCAC